MERNLELRQDEKNNNLTVVYQEQKQIVKVYLYVRDNIYLIEEESALFLGLTKRPVNFANKTYYIIDYKVIERLEFMGYEIEYHKIEIDISRDLKSSLMLNNNFADFKNEELEETNRNKIR